MYYTYILESTADPTRYPGHTSDLRARLAEHNRGKCRHTARHRPWKVKLYIAFATRKLARDFERYLKSGSGHAFANHTSGTLASTFPAPLLSKDLPIERPASTPAI